MTDPSQDTLGNEMHALVKKLFPICRSITGDGVRQTLAEIQRLIPLKVFEVPSGTRAFDWTVPNEWNIGDAYVMDSQGNKIIDFKRHTLHVVGYSTPVDMNVTLEELQRHLHSQPDQPDAIPYVTSYYKEQWGFCVTQKQRDALKPGTYRVVIETTLEKGSLTYGEYKIPGSTKQEVFLSTYVCHPSMANNELSGPVVATYLARWIAGAPRRYSYRVVFIPETIGSLVYLSKNLKAMKKNIIAGFNLTCIGDDRAYSFMPSRYGGTLADRAALAILRATHPEFVPYSFLDRGSDERQYCSPGVDLPVVSLMRSKYATYPEYHTSLDDLSVVTPQGLAGGFEAVRQCLELIERNRTYRAVFSGEPQLGKRGLYPTTSQKGTVSHSTKTLRDFLAYADGTNDLIAIGEIIKVPPEELYAAADALRKAKLIKELPRVATSRRF